MDNRWTHSWEEYYTREFRSSVAYAQRPLENDPELAKLAESFLGCSDHFRPVGI